MRQIPNDQSKIFQHSNIANDKLKWLDPERSPCDNARPGMALEQTPPLEVCYAIQ